MFKKIISMASATLLMASGFALVGSNPAFAADVSLNLSSTYIKGVAVTSATTRTLNSGNPATDFTASQDNFFLTPSQAADTSLSTTFVATDAANATVKVVKTASVITLSAANFNVSYTPYVATSAIQDMEVLVVQVTNGASTAYYAFKISALSNDATLASATIRTVSVTNLGTPNGNISSVSPGAVTISTSQATSAGSTLFVMNNIGGLGQVAIRKFAAGSTPAASDFVGPPGSLSGTITDGDIVALKVTAANNSTILYYKIVVTVGAAQQQNNNQSLSTVLDAAQVEAKRQAAVATAKTSLVDTLKSGKPITANDLNSADFNIASAKAAARVANQLLALPQAQRTDLAKIQEIVRTENFIEKVSTPDTHMQVTSQELIQQSLLAADYKYKSTVVRALIAADPASLTSLEKMAAVVKAAQATVQERKDRLAATVARINSRK